MGVWLESRAVFIIVTTHRQIQLTHAKQHPFPILCNNSDTHGSSRILTSLPIVAPGRRHDGRNLLLRSSWAWRVMVTTALLDILIIFESKQSQ